MRLGRKRPIITKPFASGSFKSKLHWGQKCVNILSKFPPHVGPIVLKAELKACPDKREQWPLIQCNGVNSIRYLEIFPISPHQVVTSALRQIYWAFALEMRRGPDPKYPIPTDLDCLRVSNSPLFWFDYELNRIPAPNKLISNAPLLKLPMVLVAGNHWNTTHLLYAYYL